jgi:hypothetical protein
MFLRGPAGDWAKGWRGRSRVKEEPKGLEYPKNPNIHAALGWEARGLSSGEEQGGVAE